MFKFHHTDRAPVASGLDTGLEGAFRREDTLRRSRQWVARWGSPCGVLRRRLGLACPSLQTLCCRVREVLFFFFLFFFASDALRVLTHEAG